MILALSVGCGRIGFESLHRPPAGGAAGGQGGSGGLHTAGSGGLHTAGSGGSTGGGAGGAGGAPPMPTCSDGIQNQDELGIDCGGIVCSLCPGCVYEAWGTPELITGLGLSGQTWGPALSADARTLVFSAYETGNEDLFVASRPDRGTVFAGATPINGVNSTDLEATPFLSADGSTLYFASDRPGGLGNRDLYLATRADLSSPFEAAVWLEALSSDQNDHLPALTPDELVLVFESTRSGGAGDADLWMAERASRSEAFSTPFDLTEVNTGQRETGPSLSADALTLYFASDRSGGAGDHDVWFSVRADAGARFDPPENLTELNSDGAELDARISLDGRELFFASDRNGSSEIWRSWRDCL